VQDAPPRVAELVGAGGIVQLTAGSLTGRLGAAPRQAARALLERGLVHLVSSDVHGPHIERSSLADAAAALADDALARRLLVDAPAAIVAGEPLPD
jgi:protein-tyrosine phosphatase